MTPPVIKYPRHPAHVAPFVEILGPAKTVAFLIEFGGTEVYMPDNPGGRGEVEKFIGAEALKALGARMNRPNPRLPMPRTWLVHALKAEGQSVTQICRRLKVTDKTVRRCLLATPDGSSDNTPTHPLATQSDGAQLGFKF